MGGPVTAPQTSTASEPSSPGTPQDCIAKHLASKINTDERFSEHMSTDEDALNLSVPNTAENISFSIPRRQYTKLEVVQARQIERMLQIHHIFIAAGAIYTMVVVILMNTAYFSWWNTPLLKNIAKYEFRHYDPPTGLLWFNQTVALPMFLYMLALCVIFSTRIFTMKSRSRTKEQYWVICLLVAMVFYLNPYPVIQQINDVLVHPTEAQKQWSERSWSGDLTIAFGLLKTGGFTASTVFYVWATIHSYRILESEITYMFYLPKIVVLWIYVALKVAMRATYNVHAAELFFATAISMLSIYSEGMKWYLPGVVFSVVSFVFEFGLALYIFAEYQKTKTVLKNADYLQYRTKQIGFRFFIYHNITFYGIFFTLYVILLVGLPHAALIFLLHLGEKPISYFDLQDMTVGINLMLLAYVTVEAYVNLPADAIGFKGWFVPQLPRGFGAEKSELEPITYRKREPPSIHGIVSDLRVNCFVMQTHVTLFNFAWLVYYWNTPKVENFKLTQDVFKFTIPEFISDKITDTHVLVVDGEDRIVIVFKGTTSTKNLKTDVNMFYSNARALLPTKLGEVDPKGDEEAQQNAILRSSMWRRARIHKGFAVAYAAVGPQLLTIVKRLQDDRRRPVFLTGHSLGGALATVCSLDLFLRLGLTRKEIFVSTFGAPRVGNRSFWQIYNENVPIHWRIVVGPDVVAKLPKVGYKHVGKKVLLTVDGDLFIDPNSLELNMWSGDVASILYHRKASYLLAMRAWCERHHGDEYLPEFWPFPVSKDDTKRFQHAMVKSTRSGMLSVHRQPTNKRARIMRLDAMIDALGDVREIDANVLTNWERLVRGMIERQEERLDGEEKV